MWWPFKTKKKLFVEKPRNTYGYRLFDAAVIEGVIVNHSSIFFGGEIRVTAPVNFQQGIVDRAGWQEVSAEAGPPRIPTISEHTGDLNKWRDRIITLFLK